MSLIFLVLLFFSWIKVGSMIRGDFEAVI